MQEFIRETKHRDHQVETEEDIKHVAKKLLATQIPKFVPWQDVYPFVSDDMSSIDHRAPHVLENYAEYKHVDPAFLAGLLEGVRVPTQSKIFQHYTNTIHPPPGKELVAFFAHGQLQKDLQGHVEHMTGDVCEQKRLVKAIREYTPLPTNREDAAIDIGNFLSELDLNTTVGQLDEERHSPLPQRKEQDLPRTEEEPVLTHVDAKPWEEEASWRNDILNTFKVNHGLPAHFSSQKVAKQILLSERTDHPLNPLMGKFQAKIDTTNVTNKDGLVDIVTDHLPDDNVKKICETQQAKTFYKSLKNDLRPTTNRDLLRLMLRPDQTFPLDKEIINLLF